MSSVKVFVYIGTRVRVNSDKSLAPELEFTVHF